ncbi:MAG: LarC family nickel insertion protein, partial [Leptolyngbyaceae cyanobacterium RU_5_1]|nr:LarC family nickel insertion protein [Leptolyngbyaceae cyanobacterium RU_5_1]
ATTLATQFGAPPAMTLHRVGLGAGSRNLPLPNILRLWIGEADEGWDRDAINHVSTPSLIPHSLETVAVLETQIDDLNPQAIAYGFEVLLATGALDVFTQAIAMKKSRSGVLLTVICHPKDIPACEAVIFRETTTLGIRRSLQERQTLARAIESVQTEYGPVRVKVAWAEAHPGKTTQTEQYLPTNVQPEYEDCAKIARQQNLPWREVHRAALQSWYQNRT